MKAQFIRAPFAARRISEASASAKPPPAAAPWTSETIGCGQRRISITISAMRRWLSRDSVTPGGSCWPARRCIAALRSSPAQNALPAPFSSTTRVSRLRWSPPK